MPFCPRCLYEFVEGTKKCVDCNAKLVEHLPEEKMATVKWLFLDTLSDIVMANMVKEALENNGIETILKTDPLHSTFSLQTTGAIGSYARLFVPRGQKKAALDILKSMIETG
ncbi:MAG: DUF2007 domain-containing protein [Candidatus Marinimicrobia bacterium]|jgi:hypothetical protein|nr:DUF2007 domain-containing protein [Candidatus Neomarinimicrobiota bacterium]MCK9483191.1 DUF2007 domain-containing protein [Candidatus Neomarinimicrobiota bacterium]MCK9558975.1 DUF2007 domain-containing protein [Candidatus Neomarinimicrobiota bacterium]MDD5061985.1 DUF2007 domain-containing protein [Candidatus Neomarinimicrobiota bacterium]MDD5231722.1 DUF2007 domain-containing protein [Candidatus Neomarinimicrobiota bacterium]